MEKTIKWLYRHGRPLDVARYKYLFLDGSREDVIDILESYQNKDGGFGHGLEPDCVNPNSSPVQSMMAFEIIDELELSSTDPIVQNLIAYFMNYAPKENDFFFSTIPSNNDYPHAPWWTYVEGRHIWGYNPTIAIAGFIYKHSLPNSYESNFAIKIIEKAIADFIDKPTKEMHELRCYLDMINAVANYNHFARWDEFLPLFLSTISSVIEKDESKWFTEYCVRPLQFFDNPASFGFDEHRDLVLKEINMIMKMRNEEGYWDITWKWDSYPED
ncbi:MAG TPA: hypothetical protein VIK94_01385, partial [Bacilli bacterium]